MEARLNVFGDGNGNFLQGETRAVVAGIPTDLGEEDGCEVTRQRPSCPEARSFSETIFFVVDTA